MTTPRRTDPETIRMSSGLKSFLAVLGLVLIYVWSSRGLAITPGQLASGETWRAMGDLVMRMGPFHRIQRCQDAQTVWGNEDPWAGRPDPAKVRAVCEEGRVVYWYRSDYLEEQVAYVREIWPPLTETFRMAILGAAFGALLAVPFSLLGARNLVKSKAVYYTVRTLLNLIRTIPDMVWAALLTGVFGLGALPGVMALTVFSFGMVAKLLSESLETIDPGPLEAMRACGANWFQLVRYGVVPQVLPQFLAYTLYVLEVDVRASAVLGLVGAGGIGVTLSNNLTLARYRNVGAIIVVMLLAVVLMDYISTKIRERLV